MNKVVKILIVIMIHVADIGANSRSLFVQELESSMSAPTAKEQLTVCSFRAVSDNKTTRKRREKALIFRTR